MNELSRRHFLKVSGALGAGALFPTITLGNTPTGTVRDRLWLWSVIEGAIDNNYGNWKLPNNGNSRMTPIQAAESLGIPNIIFIRCNMQPTPPYDEYAALYRNTPKLGWSFVGDGGRTSADEQEHVLELVQKMPNMAGLFMDDFFKGNALPAGTASPFWLAKNDVTFPVILTFQFDKPIDADRLELLQSAWKSGHYRTSDIAVDLGDGKNWKEVGTLRLENHPDAKVGLALSDKGIKALRLRLLGTHDTDGAHSVGLGSVRLFKGDQSIDISAASVDASSTFPGHPPENLLGGVVEPEAAAAVSVARLREIKKRMEQMPRKPDLGAVLYTHQLNPAIRHHLELCDVVSFWSWTADELMKLPENFAKYQEIIQKKRTLLGVYMWDFGKCKPLSIDLMKMQCDMGLKWLKSGVIEGMIFCLSSICDLDIEAVRWSKQWIAEHGREMVG